MLMIRTVKPETGFGRVSVKDCQPTSVEPSEISVPPIVTSSTQKPGAVGCCRGGRIVEGPEREQHGLAGVRRQAAGLAARSRAEKPVKPGTFSFAVGSASGFVSVVVSVHGEARVGRAAVGRDLDEAEVPAVLLVPERVERQRRRVPGRDRHRRHDRLVAVVVGARVQGGIARLAAAGWRRPTTDRQRRQRRRAREASESMLVAGRYAPAPSRSRT